MALRFGPFDFEGQVRLSPETASGYVELGPRKYGGSLIIRADRDSTLTVVQETGLEEYLSGVLPVEMSPEWPVEALKAQAVVARTFALGNLGKFQRSGFDFSDDARSQVYAGLDRQDPRTTAAVRETEGEVLAWRGKPLKVFFHSCCGGHSADVATVWGSAEKTPPPGRGVRDRTCEASPHYSWTAYFSNEAILAALQGHGILVTSLRGISVGRRDRASGYAKTLRLTAGRRVIELRANDFRNWIGSTELRSTKILRIARRKHGYQFEGSGYGHGVGLCQWGARLQADRGKDYRQILKFYFPGAEIRKRDD